MYLKMQSGDSIDLALICSPKGVQKEVTYWKDGKPVSDKTEGARPSTRYLIEVLDIEFDEELTLQASATLFKQIRRAVKASHKPWPGFRFNLTRDGEGLQTRYIVNPLPGDNLDVTIYRLDDDEPKAVAKPQKPQKRQMGFLQTGENEYPGTFTYAAYRGFEGV